MPEGEEAAETLVTEETDSDAQDDLVEAEAIVEASRDVDVTAAVEVQAQAEQVQPQGFFSRLFSRLFKPKSFEEKEARLEQREVESNEAIERVSPADDDHFLQKMINFIQENQANKLPTASDMHYTFNEDGSITIHADDLLSQSSDADGDVLQVTKVFGAEYGEIVNNHNGTWTYTPEANFNTVQGGAEALSFTISDGEGGEVTRNITLQINPMDEKPHVEMNMSYADSPLETWVPMDLQIGMAGGQVDNPHIQQITIIAV